MAAPMLVPLILLGGATIALAASSAKKKRVDPGPGGGGKTYTLDATLPAPLRDQILAALTTEQDPAKLDAFAGALATNYPLSAAALRTKAAMLRSMQPPPAPPPLPVPIGPSPAPSPPASPQPAPVPPPVDWQTQLVGVPDPPRSDVVRQLMGQNDPNALEAYAKLLEAQYPIAAWALRVREAALRGVAPPPQPSPAPTPPVPTPQPPPSVLPSPAPTPSPAPSPAPSPVPPLLAGLDVGMPIEMQKAVVGALTTETDPAKLEGFASAIQAQYPISAGLLMAKAQALRLVHPPGPIPVPPIPVSPITPPPVLTSGTYTVISGDYPIKIAQKLTGDGGRWHQLVAANPQKKLAADGNFASLLPGEVLRLPAVWASLPRPTPSPSPAPSPAPGPVQPAGLTTAPGTYTVQPGDFPIKIAKKLVGDGGRWHELVAANPQKKTAADGNFASLNPGEVLKVPASWSAPSLPALATPPALPAGGSHAANA